MILIDTQKEEFTKLKDIRIFEKSPKNVDGIASTPSLSIANYRFFYAPSFSIR
jgi:hypothetical protein